ncbi:[protein-PII] uridylyltransferase [Deferribacterales bacterium Es71-Z0220]|uniref:[protein-PII] uridylyltransferase n=1 Tax=Deferrivibrio essentukiensis TaxID=2880922 RepID=UPI001F621D74|nr:[protein-PII] uridylyltransferase [Deferrivibrio essentukiensis]MCB4205336.1 [protein-PII] uridylyltransferase [Deferrivibrio essentukiensis]
MKSLSTIDIKSLKSKFWHRWESIKENRQNTRISWQIMGMLASLCDDTVKEIYNLIDNHSENICLLAIGGYARQEMAPYSDIDILILHRKALSDSDKDLINIFTTTLWDLKLQPGIQIKELSEITDAALEDEVVKTSFLDNRFLIGEVDIYNDFLKILNEKVINRGKEKFLLQKVSEQRNRAKKYRDSIYKIEPNIKEGKGGVRDVNTIYWISKTLYNDNTLRNLINAGIIDISDYDELVESAELIHRIRIEIHYFHNRKYDVLSIDSQPNIAEILGYINTSSMLAVEVFLMDYYKAARKIRDISRKVIDNTIVKFIFKDRTSKSVKSIATDLFKYENFITTNNKAYFLDNHKNILYVFYYAAQYSLRLSESLKELLEESLYLISDSFVKKYGEVFLKIISKTPYSSKILTLMADTGVLQKFIPEFDKIVCKPQFDMYHHYTVDEHTILAVGYIDKLHDALPSQYADYQDEFKKLERKDLLILAILLHDIGKGQGKNHSIVGAKMSKIICKRLGMNMDDTDTIYNLVEQHLLMSHISQRRDIYDIEVIEHFISHLNNKEELRLLFLLTYADMNAVGGNLFNEWKNSLLKELFKRAYYQFDQDDIQTEFKNIVESKKKRLLERVAGDAELLSIFSILEDDYIFSNKIKHIHRHIKMASSLKDNISLVEYAVRKDIHAINIMVCTKDKAGILKKLVGAIAYMGFNILGAQIYTFGKNIAVDTFQVSLENVDLEQVEATMDRLKSTIDSILLSKKDIDSLLQKSRANIFGKKKLQHHLNSKVNLDNEISSQYSVIDVFAYDYKGLLYDILKIFEENGIYVQNAKISTDVDRVVDSFAVTDLNGNKLSDNLFQEKIKPLILSKLESPNKTNESC